MAATQTTARDFTAADATPIELHEVTDAMLRTARKNADISMLAQTVYPSDRIGAEYVNPLRLVTSIAACGTRVPEDAAPDAQPLLTVLPSTYHSSALLAAEWRAIRYPDHTG